MQMFCHIYITNFRKIRCIEESYHGRYLNVTNGETDTSYIHAVFHSFGRTIVIFFLYYHSNLYKVGGNYLSTCRPVYARLLIVTA
jgi:hypothetical protein